MPKADRSWFRMAVQDDVAEIHLLDEIGFFGVTVQDFKAAFDQVKSAAQIRLLVNSPGGDVFAGVAIYNILSSVREKLSVEVLGLAASAASVAALAGKAPPVMGEGSYFMIHEPAGLAWGTADDMRKMSETLDTMTGQFADIYADRSALTREEALAAMKAETWYTAEQAVAAGFASEVKDYGEAAACLSAEDARRLVLESRFDMRAETARMKREAEKSLRDAGLSRTQAQTEVARIFAQRDAEPEARSESEGQDVPDIEDVVLMAQRQKALTQTLSRSN